MLNLKHLLSFAVAAALIAPAATSHAQKRIVVLDVEGARNNVIRDSLADVIGEENRIISSARYKRAARKLKTKRTGTAHFKKVARQLEADGVLQSLVIDEGSRYALKLRLREGSTGRTVKKLTIKLSSPKISSPMRRKLAKKLLPAIDTLRFAEGDERDAEDAAEDVAGDGEEDELAARKQRKADRIAARREAKREARRRKAEKERARKERAEKRREAAARAKAERRERDRKRRDRDEDMDDDDISDEEMVDEAFDDEEPIDDDLEETDVAMADGGDDFDDDFDDDDDARARKRLDTDDEPDQRTAADRRRTGALALFGGVSVINRKLAFSYRADLVDAPQGYSGPPAPAGHVSGELYPLALDRTREGFATKVGIGFEVDQVIGLSTVVDDGTMQETLATEETRYGAGLIVRHNFGTKVTSPSVKLSAGYNRLSFSVAPSEAIIVDLPNTSYTFIDPGLEVRIPLNRTLAFSAGGEALLITASGEMQRRDQYGSAKLTGFDGHATLEYLMGKHFMVQAKARYTAIGFAFTGDGDMTVMRDGDASSQDIGGALDTYMSGTVSLGYLY